MDAIRGKFKDVMHAIASRNKPDTTMHQSNSTVDLPRSIIGRGGMPPIEHTTSLPLLSGESAILTLSVTYR